MAWLVQEVPDPSDNQLGCGSIVAMIIGALAIGLLLLCFVSGKEDKKTETVESRTEEPQRTEGTESRSSSYVPESSHPKASAPTAEAASKPQKAAAADPAKRIMFDDDMKTAEATVSAAPADNNIAAETDTETPVLTEKERRKAERQAKREARRREKAEKNN